MMEYKENITNVEPGTKRGNIYLNSFNVVGAFNSRSKKPKQEENKSLVNCHNMFECLQEEGNDFSSSSHKDFKHLQEEGNSCSSSSNEVVQEKNNKIRKSKKECRTNY